MFMLLDEVSSSDVCCLSGLLFSAVLFCVRTLMNKASEKFYLGQVLGVFVGGLTESSSRSVKLRIPLS